MYLTFDLGTTLFKVGVVGEGGELLAVERVKAPGIEVRGGALRACHPGDVIGAVREGVWGVGRKVGGLAGVRGVSFASQANSFVPLNERGYGLLPFTLWPSRLATGEEVRVGEVLEGFAGVTGIPRVGPLLSVTKLAYLRRTEPGLWEQVGRVCWLSDYLTWYMTGEWVTAAGVAGLSGLMDVRGMRWWDRALAAVGLAEGQLPRIVRAGTVVGEVKGEVAREWGLPLGCKFVVGDLDQYVGAIGAGAVNAGDVCETTGTVLAAVRCSDRWDEGAASRGAFQGPGVREGMWWGMSFSSTSANLLEWYRNRYAPGVSFEELSREAGEASRAAPVGVYVDGEEGCFANVAGYSRGEVVRGIMERVARQLREQIAVLCGDQKPAVIRAAGGGARSAVWVRMMEEVVGVKVVGGGEEVTSRGAGVLAKGRLGLD